MSKPTVVLDFDGVLHAYDSPWTRASEVLDGPVPGAMAWVYYLMRDGRFNLAILSSRSHQWGGRKVMKQWLTKHMTDWLYQERPKDSAPGAVDFFHEPDLLEACETEARALVAEIRFPFFKPPAVVTIDDRAITFDGTFPSLDEISAFKPWNKGGTINWRVMLKLQHEVDVLRIERDRLLEHLRRQNREMSDIRFAMDKIKEDADHNAPWLSQAHMICTNRGIDSGHISDRLRALDEYVDALGEELMTMRDRLANDLLSADRMVAWLESGKPPQVAFTEGRERDLAYRIEAAIGRAAEQQVTE